VTGPVVVVSADPEVAEEVRFSLPPDVEILTAVDARSAMGLLAGTTPAVVIVDLMTGRAGGFALAKDMAQSDRLAAIPVIVLIERDQDRWLAGQAGATEILRKPVGGSTLVAAVTSVLDGNVAT
jgi:DNA-binding response OmpR family regulator